MNIKQLYKTLPTDLKRIVFDFTYYGETFISYDDDLMDYYEIYGICIENEKEKKDILDNLKKFKDMFDNLKGYETIDDRDGYTSYGIHILEYEGEVKKSVSLTEFFEDIFSHRP